LYERQDRGAIGPLVELAAESASPLGRMHAMYVLAGLEALSAEVVAERLDDPHPRVRQHAVRLAEKVLHDDAAVREKLYAMAGDDDPRVRYQLAFTLGEISGDKATSALARIAAGDVADHWVRLAVLSSSLGRAGDLFCELSSDPHWRAASSGRAFLAQLAEQAGLQNRADQIAEVFNVLDRFPTEEKDLSQAVVGGLSKGLAGSGSPLRQRLAAGGKAGQLLGEMIERSKRLALDARQPVDVRVEAVGSLALASFEEARDILPELLDGRQPQEVQMAALRSLGRFRGSEVAAMIVDAWGGFSPKVRGEAAEALFARSDRLAVLLSAVERRRISRSQLDPARIQLLKTHAEGQIRATAERLFGDLELARREEAVAAYRDALDLPADASRGKAVFERECSQCHKLEGVGFDLGLPLMTVSSRGPDGILLQILDPNRDVNPAYLNYIVLTDDGLSITGMITAETATSITLTRAEGESDTVLRTNIEEMQNTGLSIMPEGFEEQLTKQDLADVVGYLMSIE